MEYLLDNSDECQKSCTVHAVCTVDDFSGVDLQVIDMIGWGIIYIILATMSQ